jgi:hypothetical protein
MEPENKIDKIYPLKRGQKHKKGSQKGVCYSLIVVPEFNGNPSGDELIQGMDTVLFW